MPIDVILTGSTGMVGEGVLLECLGNPAIGRVLVINRRPLGRSHAKLREIVHADFFDLSPIAEQLVGFDACFFCLGLSSFRRDPDEYRRTTYDLTMHVAHTLATSNPQMTFCYVTGLGTDGTERGHVRWARVKGETENALLRLFPNAFMFRPGFMQATPGQRNLQRSYKLLGWTFPFWRRVWPSGCCTLAEVGRAMIRVATVGDATRVVEVPAIIRLARGQTTGTPTDPR